MDKSRGFTPIFGKESERKLWIDSGAKWFDPKLAAENWNLEEQLKNIPDEFK